MDADPGFIPVVSRHLSRALKQIGMNSLTVRRRRRAFLYAENLITLEESATLSQSTSTVYHFGSQTEGTTTPGLESDMDTLICYDDFIAIQDWADWQAGTIFIFLMSENDTAPGYCRLQLLSSNEPIPGDYMYPEVPGLHQCLHQCGNGVFMKSANFYAMFPDNFSIFTEINGPAQSDCAKPGYLPRDVVVAFRCCSLIRQLRDWERRPRRGHWPPPDLIQQVLVAELFIVPVGCKLSPTKDLEWRISTSGAERLLMFSMSMTQLKCYVVLKMTMKSCVTPVVGKSITSYHCKTALFHCMEEIATEFWEESNLVPCINQCLSMLLLWVTNGHCPHFIIPESNLFAGKIGAHNKQQLESILQDLIASNGRFLLCIKTDSLGLVLCNNLSNLVQTSRTPTNLTVTAHLEINKNRCHNQTTGAILVKNVSMLHGPLLQSVFNTIIALRDLIRQSTDVKKRAAQSILQFYLCWNGFLLMSISLSQRKGIPKKALQCVRQVIKTDMVCRLKLAAAFYCNGELLKAEKVLLEAEENFRREPILTLCCCYYHQPGALTLQYLARVHDTMSERERDKLVALCVRYTPQETHCMPPGLRHELQRSVGDDDTHRDPLDDRWMVLAVVDCIPYMLYLQFLTFKDMGRHDLKLRSLHRLEQCLREEHNFGHSETAWNLLGQCNELEDKPEAATLCYRTSLDIRPRNNAANLHIQNLRYRSIRGDI